MYKLATYRTIYKILIFKCIKIPFQIKSNYETADLLPGANLANITGGFGLMVLPILVTRELVCTFFSYKFCHHSSGGAAVNSALSQKDTYLSPQKRFLINCLLGS
jgi:hypothetical protein